MSPYWIGATLSLTSLGCIATVSTTPSNAASAPPLDCFAALHSAPSNHLNCTHEAWMTATERADLLKVTRGYLLDAHCTVAVSINRRVIDEGLSASDRVITTPPQPVTCSLQTRNGPLTITGTFAPSVIFKNGFAVDATPGIANITGVNSYIAWPVIAYVNGATQIKSAMAATINAFRAQPNARQQQARN